MNEHVDDMDSFLDDLLAMAEDRMSDAAKLRLQSANLRFCRFEKPDKKVVPTLHAVARMCAVIESHQDHMIFDRFVFAEQMAGMWRKQVPEGTTGKVQLLSCCVMDYIDRHPESFRVRAFWRIVGRRWPKGMTAKRLKVVLSEIDL